MDAVYTDFAKAFDKVDHCILINKLRAAGIGGPLLKWIASYLSNRTQLVKIINGASFTFKQTSGVPQGSHLGPLFFILFINDLIPLIKHSECLLYADDAKIFKAINCQNDVAELQEDLDSIFLWSVRNKLPLNLDKCKVIHFSRIRANIVSYYKMGSTQLSEVAEIRDLGLIMNNKLDYNEHISRIIQKASKTLGFISRMSVGFRDPFTLIALDNTLVRPHLDYASTIWSPIFESAKRKIESVQHKFIRLLAFRIGLPMSRLDHDYTQFELFFNITKLVTRRDQADLIFLHKLINANIICPELLERIPFSAPKRILRTPNIFYIPLRRETWSFHQDIIIRICNAANNINLSQSFNLFGSSIMHFKSSLKLLNC